LDSLIYGYYAEILQKKYEAILALDENLSNCITAYRRIPLGDDKNKSTIHFAKDVFDEVRFRTIQDDKCAVLAFDIKSFFSSLDHNLLYKEWSELIGETKLPRDHLNVFKSATNFSFIYKDDLRKYRVKKGRRAGFDEKKLATIRNSIGKFSLFESVTEFRECISSGKIRVYKNPFRNKEKQRIKVYSFTINEVMIWQGRFETCT